MPLDNATIAERVLDRINKGRPQKIGGIYKSAIVTMIPAALQQLAEEVAASPNATLLQQSYTVSLTSGIKTLTGNDNGGKDLTQMLIETLAKEEVTISTGHKMTWVGNARALQYPAVRGANLRSFTVIAKDLRVADDTGTLVTGTPTVTFVANFIPLISEVPKSLEEDMELVLYRIALGEINKAKSSEDQPPQGVPSV